MNRGDFLTKTVVGSTALAVAGNVSSARVSEEVNLPPISYNTDLIGGGTNIERPNRILKHKPPRVSIKEGGLCGSMGDVHGHPYYKAPKTFYIDVEKPNMMGLEDLEYFREALHNATCIQPQYILPNSYRDRIAAVQTLKSSGVISESEVKRATALEVFGEKS